MIKKAGKHALKLLGDATCTIIAGVNTDDGNQTDAVGIWQELCLHSTRALDLEAPYNQIHSIIFARAEAVGPQLRVLQD